VISVVMRETGEHHAQLLQQPGVAGIHYLLMLMQERCVCVCALSVPLYHGIWQAGS
jgi:hypothetical protein